MRRPCSIGSRSVVAGTVVVGAGSWGTTIASLLAAQGPTTLWVRSADLADMLSVSRENRRYLPGVALPRALRITASLSEAVRGADVVLVAVPSHGFRSVLEAMARSVAGHATVVSLTKGIEAGTNLRMSELIGEVLPGRHAGVLCGPNFAHEVAAGQPAASVVALPEEALARRVQERLHCGTFRVYTATDVIGCEVAGASKNVMAIAAGMSDGLGFGDNTRALLVTRGLAEQTRLGYALGAQRVTFGGLAGIGDLVATCTSPQSRNRSVGVQLAQGRTLSEITAGTYMVAEGVRTARPLVELAHAHGVELPIVEQVAALVAGETTPEQAVSALMDRPARRERDDELTWAAD